MRFPIVVLIIAMFLSTSLRGETPTTQPAQGQIEQRTLMLRAEAQLLHLRSENEQLRRQVDRLNTENEQLKAELFTSNSRINAMIKPVPFSLTPQPPTNAAPEHANSFQFNGRNVYIIPLDARSKHADPVRDAIEMRDRDLPLIDDRPRPNASK